MNTVPETANLSRRIEQSAKIRIATAKAGIPQEQFARIVVANEIGGSVSYHTVTGVTLLDTLCDEGCITAMQRLYGTQLLTLSLVSQPAITPEWMYDTGVRVHAPADDHATAFDQVIHVMRLLAPEHRALVQDIVLCDKAPPLRHWVGLAPAALDDLGDALASMREHYGL